MASRYAYSMNRRSIPLIVSLFTLILYHAAIAAVSLPKILGDNLVLQRELPVPIWGQAQQGEKVTVRFGGQEKSTTADDQGKWRVNLDALIASAEPRDLTIVASNTIVLKNILVGEVWICGGQSNMEYPMGRGGAFRPPRTGPDPMPQDLARCEDPQIRLFRVEKVYSLPDVTSKGWTECKPDTLNLFSAVGYYFGKNLHDQVKVPIGLIQSCWGGTRIEPWTPPQAYLSVPGFHLSPSTQPIEIDHVRPGKNYRSMIQPLVPYALRGAIWYQGESNLIDGDDTGPHYADKMKALIDSWRSAWGEGNFPFYYVQIAPCQYTKRKDKTPHTEVAEPNIWEGQMLALAIPNTGMAATVDIVDNTSDIHPPNKWDVGKRLSLWALARDYGHKDLVYSGPTFKKMEIQNGKAKISFDHVGGGLVATDGNAIKSFTVAGGDGKFQPADATIEGEMITVSSPQVHAPVAVRYAWTETPDTNLANKEGLPAFPFRTDSAGQ
jgi:sialate O-acetylesterase